MLRPTAKITIGSLAFDFINSLEIVSNWKNLTDRGSLLIPKKLSRNGETIVVGSSGLFKRGDKVEIELGYFPDAMAVFSGYISKIVPDSPFRIEFEDDAYLFKQNSITYSEKDLTLKKLLEDLCPIPFESVDANLGSFRITRANFAEVLLELKKTYGLVSWIREGVLYCGLAYWPEGSEEHELNFQQNIIDHSLEYRREDDVKIKIKAISMLDDNQKLEVEVGDPEGAQRTLTFFGLNESDLEKTAERELPKFKFEGYRGDLLTFGAPRVRHGDTIHLTDDKVPEREGSYLVDEVVTSQSVSGGFRQRIKLGSKV